MDEPQVDLLQRVILAEQEDVFVRSPYGFAQVALRTFDVLRELALLRLVALQLMGFCVDVLPSEELARLVEQRRCILRHYPNEGALKCAGGRSALRRDRREEALRCRLACGVLWRQNDKCE